MRVSRPPTRGRPGRRGLVAPRHVEPEVRWSGDLDSKAHPRATQRVDVVAPRGLVPRQLHASPNALCLAAKRAAPRGGR